MAIETKSQIRPRRSKFHFTNAEILLLDTTGSIALVAEPALGQVLAMERAQFRSNIVQAYTNISAAANFPAITLIDDFNVDCFLEDTPGGFDAITGLFGHVGVNLVQIVAPQLGTDVAGAGADCVPFSTFRWASLADVFANGGIFMSYVNGVAGDLTGGDTGNYLDVFIDYKIIDL